MDSRYLLQLKSVSYKIDGNLINDNISFDINSGDLISIIGPNGSGKSTLIRLVSGDIKPTSGEILFLDKKIQLWDINHLAKKRAVLSQATAISFPFTVLDIITMGRFPYDEEGKLGKSEMEYCYFLIEIFDLTNLIHRSYTSLSGGEQQRVQLARSFTQIWNEESYADKFLILDEPTNNLDIKHQLALFDLIIDLNKKGLTVIIVLHDLNHAIIYSKKTIMLKNGELKHHGNTEDTFSDSNLQNIFDVDLKVHSISNNYKTIILNVGDI